MGFVYFAEGRIGGFFCFFLRGEARWRVVGQFLEKGSGFLEIATMYFTSRAFMICLCTN